MQRDLLRITIKAADAEQAYRLPAAVKRVLIYNRSNSQALVSFTQGEVASDGGYVLQERTSELGSFWDTGSIDSEPTHLYVASSQVGTILEAWISHDVPSLVQDFSADFANQFQ